MVSHKQHSIYNLELGKEIFVLRVLLDHETIITSLFLQFPLENTVGFRKCRFATINYL